MDENVTRIETEQSISDGKKEFKNFKLRCQKHEDITNGSVCLNFATKHTDGKVHETHYIYCLQCINDLLKKFQDSGEFGKVEIIPIYEEKPL